MTESAIPRIFDRRRIRAARERAARRFAESDFLHRRAMADIADRLETVTRSFERAAFYGVGALESALTLACGVGSAVHGDLTQGRLGAGPGLVFDEERNPLADGALDLAVSLFTLHAANDVVGALAQWRRALKPDGLFLGATFGEETLRALKAAFYEAETELSGGASPRFAPFAGVRDLGAALQRAGFALPVVDVDAVTVRYEDPLKILDDLKAMGERGALAARGRPLSRAVVARALARFAEAGAAARFDIVYLTGWAPHESQQKPLRPGSAKASLEEAVKDRPR